MQKEELHQRAVHLQRHIHAHLFCLIEECLILRHGCEHDCDHCDHHDHMNLLPVAIFELIRKNRMGSFE